MKLTPESGMCYTEAAKKRGDGMQSQKIIYRGGQGEIEEKKSRFIAHIQPAETEEEAAAYISRIKKEFWDARHNCSAFVLGENQELTRCSDDGEPSGTAGRPMLEVLLQEELHNVVAVVTRYFGGTLLGTGGLVRAYRKAVCEGLAHCKLAEKRQGVILEIMLGNPEMGKIQSKLACERIPLLESEYGQLVRLRLAVEQSRTQWIEEKITDLTSGQAHLHWEQPMAYAVIDGELVLFDAKKNT